MKLVTSNQNDCVAASLAMLLGVDTGYIKLHLFTALTRPFSGQWADYPKVPDMNIICAWLWEPCGTALVPFEYNPQCTPHKDCPAVPVYPTRYSTSCHTSGRMTSNPDIEFDKQMDYGPGLIEGITEGEVGHMCAWDGKVIYDPRGYCYTRNVAKEKFGYQITRFWLAVKGKTL